jgi:hypothetical protein
MDVSFSLQAEVEQWSSMSTVRVAEQVSLTWLQLFGMDKERENLNLFVVEQNPSQRAHRVQVEHRHQQSQCIRELRG